MAKSAEPEPKPVVVVLHGNDPLSIRRSVDDLVKACSADPGIADMNITRLDGRQASDEELRTSVFAMPFLAERRLVIVTNPLAKANTDAGRKRYQALLDGLPDFTTLVLVMEDTLERGRWKSLHDHHWLRRWLEKAGKRGQLQLCALPEIGRMPEWIRKEAVNQGGQFHPEAAKALVAHVGNDTQQATQEIIKLLTYVDFKRPVDMDDVDQLVAQGGQADVFEMVDALAAGNARGALTQLHRLLEEQEPITLFGMVVRQFRLLLQAREIIDERRGADIASELRLHPFVAEKLSQQARRFKMDQLVMIYHRLLDMDEMMKNGQMPLDLSLDTFIAGLAK